MHHPKNTSLNTHGIFPQTGTTWLIDNTGRKKAVEWVLWAEKKTLANTEFHTQWKYPTRKKVE